MVQDHLQLDWSCSTACSDIATGPTDSAPSGLSAATSDSTSATGVAVSKVEALDLSSGILKPVAEVSKRAGGETDGHLRITLWISLKNLKFT